MKRLAKGWIMGLCVSGLLLALSLPQTVGRAGGPEDGEDGEPPVTVLYRVGMYHVVRGEYEQAMAAFSKALALEPDFDEAYLARGDCYAGLGQHERALSDYSAAIALLPGYGQPYYQRARVYIALGQTGAAVTDLEAAVERMAAVPEPHLALGDLYYDCGQHEAATAMYRRYVELAGANAETYVLARLGMAASVGVAAGVAH